MLNKAKRQMAGALLPGIPNREKWEDFLSVVKTEWNVWRHDLTKFPKCLIVLYGGLAFYEYDENTFWPQFSMAVGSGQLPNSQLNEIKIAFSQATETNGFRIQHSNKGMWARQFIRSAFHCRYGTGFWISVAGQALHLCI